MRRKRQAHFFFIIVFFVIVALGLNPVPAEVTPDNVYRKVSHLFLHEKSEYETAEYIQDAASQDGKYQDSILAAIYENNPVTTVLAPPAQRFVASVLPAKTEIAQVADSKWIEVDLSDQRIMAWENGEKKLEFAISSGKPWTPTKTGEFRIWIKLRYATMKGGSQERGDYYYLPNVPYVMYYDGGYGIHGAYWHNNFGHVMSHGCINMKPEEAGQLFEWATPYLDGKSVVKSASENPGTRVIIHE